MQSLQEGNKTEREKGDLGHLSDRSKGKKLEADHKSYKKYWKSKSNLVLSSGMVEQEHF